MCIRDRQPSRTAWMEHSEIHSSIRTAKPQQALVARLRTVLSRFLGGESAPSARWDDTRVSIKTAGYLRSWTTHDRRLEDGRPAILVLPDVSGSMSQFASKVTALAATLAKLGMPGADVITVVHVNGFPVEEKINSQPARRIEVRGTDGTYRYYEDLMKRYDVRIVLAAADWDGAWVYKWLAEQASVQRLLWLDVYCSSYGEPRIRPLPLEDEERTEWQSVLHKITYADRCSDAEDFVRGLEKMLAVK